MPASAVTPQRAPRRPRYLIPVQTPYRGELIAALGTAAVLVHVIFAQVTLVLVVAFQLTSRLSRWRPEWLAVPAGAGLVWTLAIGPATAAADLAAGPRRVLRYFAGAAGAPGRILHLAAAFGGVTHWLPGQLPLALVLAAAEAGVLWWLDWLHGGETTTSGAKRSGLIVALRRRWTAATIRSGGVVTWDGGCVGVDVATGGPAAISWQEAEGGVLCVGPGWSAQRADPAEAGTGLAGVPGPGDGTGLARRRGLAARPGPPDGGGLAETCFMLAHAGIRRRKPVIVIDLTGSRRLSESLAAACAGADAPLRSFGAAGPGYYEPVRGGDPAQAASLVMGMIDWTGSPDQHRRACAAYLADAFALLAAAPADPRMPVLDDLAGLLSPAALRARLGRVPAYNPRRGVLADRVRVSVSQAEADPAMLHAAADQLPKLRASALGHWLAPGPGGVSLGGPAAGPGGISGGEAAGGPGRINGGGAAGGPYRISLGQAVRDRAVVTFSLDRAVHGQSAAMIARLAAVDLMAVCAELGRIPVSGDGLAWIHGSEAVAQPVLAELIASGAGAGIAIMLSMASAPAADRLAGAANVLVASGPADPALAVRFADLADALAGPGPAGIPADRNAKTPDYPLNLPRDLANGGPVLPPAASGEFAMLVKGPQPRVLLRCRGVSGFSRAGRR
jgi:hypothetical protein